MTVDILLETDRATVVHGRWEDLVQAVGEDNFRVDVTITDPPYTDHVQRNVRSLHNHGSGPQVTQYDLDFAPLATGQTPARALLQVTNRWVLCFCALEQFADYLEAAGGHYSSEGCYVRSGVWRKKQAAPQLSGDRPANSCEGLAIMHRNLRGKGERLRWNGRGKHAWYPVEDDEDDAAVPDFVEHERDRGKGPKRHPAQKPAALCDELVALYSEPEELVFDCYAGSGALAAAALRAGRRVLAVDSDRQWAEYTADRLRAMVGGA